MKLPFKFLLVLLFFGVISVNVSSGQPNLQSGKLIPVYPGSTLKTEFEPGDSKMCCSFETKDSFDKVIGFYESALKIKPLDPPGLSAQLPFLEPQVDEMLKQMPQGMKIKFFVLHVVDFQGQKGAELFEVVSTLQGIVEFEVNPSQFTGNDSHFESEWIGEKGQSEGIKYADPEILIAALPSGGPSGYEKGEQNVDATPGNPPFVDVTYRKLIKKGKGGESGSDDKFIAITISISDNYGAPEFAEEMIKAQRDIEKAVKVKGKYNGVESVEKNEYGCVGASKRFIVNNRFLVDIQGLEMCDLAVINQLIDMMNLNALPE
jgi:hypothetical protein